MSLHTAVNRLLGKPPLMKTKLSLIDTAFRRFGAKSFADLGGVWGVEGGYSFYAAEKWGASRSYLVDTHPTEKVQRKAAQCPGLSIVRGSFGDPAIAETVQGVDVVFLFDTLLHQVNPDWTDILKLYSWAPTLLIYNQQWTGRETVRLFDLGEEEYFRNIPHSPDEPTYQGLFDKLDTPHPDHGGRLWRDVHHVWQWGITDEDLTTKAAELGYYPVQADNDGRFGSLPNFENHGFVFRKMDLIDQSHHTAQN